MFLSSCFCCLPHYNEVTVCFTVTFEQDMESFDLAICFVFVLSFCSFFKFGNESFCNRLLWSSQQLFWQLGVVCLSNVTRWLVLLVRVSQAIRNNQANFQGVQSIQCCCNMHRPIKVEPGMIQTPNCLFCPPWLL